MPDAIDLAAFRAALCDTCDGVVAAREELIRLDALAGDGDLGATLATGFKAVRVLIDSTEYSDIGSMLTDVGRELGRRAPSTLGTLLSGAFARMGKAVAGKAAVDGADLSDALRAACDAIEQRGGVTTGQRTILDALEPSARAAREAQAANVSVVAVVARAAEAARTGAAATARMEPQVGRAAWIGSRVVGEPDAGATAWAVMLEAFAVGVAHHGAAAD
jgi:dihydroxyacetone kinase-like protein